MALSKSEPWRNRIVGEGVQPASQFVAHPNNWRIHPQPQRDAMRGALNEVGWVQRVIVNARTGYLPDQSKRRLYADTATLNPLVTGRAERNEVAKIIGGFPVPIKEVCGADVVNMQIARPFWAFATDLAPTRVS